MFKFIKNKKSGFTLIEIVVALALLMMMGGFAISTITSISQTRMRESAQTIKSEFEVTRNFAKTHGGQAVFSIQKVDEGLLITRTGENLTTDEILIEDKTIELFYKKTGERDDDTYQLGTNDADDVINKTLKMMFSQTDGAIIGPHMLDYIIISNGSKNYKLIIQQESGMMYYDYELDPDMSISNERNDDVKTIKEPKFILNGQIYDSVVLNFTGTSIQPEIMYDSRNIKIGGVYRAIDPGEYRITFTLKDPYSMVWDDETTEPKTLVWEIE